ncbi:MAG: hypothetical protein PHW33_05030 [Candidatus Portnoybacteria bacterium]|nr:hypothetical protein [Candidatus Portnoybacteria bacterium]
MADGGWRIAESLKFVSVNLFAQGRMSADYNPSGIFNQDLRKKLLMPMQKTVVVPLCIVK